MKRRRIALIAVSLLASLAFYSLYQGNLTFWDGIAIVVTPTTDIESEEAIILTETDLLAHPSITASLAGATVDEPFVIDVTNEMEEFEALMVEKGGDPNAGYYYLQSGADYYTVTYISYGGVLGDPIYMYLSGMMMLVAVGLVVTGLRK